MKSVTVGLALCALLAVSAYGQTVAIASANVPFPFYVGNAGFAPGQYDVSRMLFSRNVCVIRPAEGTGVFFFVVDRNLKGTASPTSALIFHRYGSTYFFSQMRTEGETLVRELPPSNLERESAKAAQSIEISVEARRR